MLLTQNLLPISLPLTLKQLMKRQYKITMVEHMQATIRRKRLLTSKLNLKATNSLKTKYNLLGIHPPPRISPNRLSNSKLMLQPLKIKENRFMRNQKHKVFWEEVLIILKLLMTRKIECYLAMLLIIKKTTCKLTNHIILY